MRDPITVAFSQRLNALCDAAGIAEKDREIAVAKMFGSKPAITQKWLQGSALPSYRKCIAIASRFNVASEWLMTGRRQRRIDSTTH